MSQNSPAVALIAQMIAPAIFILATGNLINSAMQRISRIVDRTRALLIDLPVLTEGPHLQSVVDELRVQRRRASSIELALSLYYLAVGCFVAASLAVAINFALDNRLLWGATGLTIVGAVALLGGSIALFVETRLATGLVRDEINRGLSAKR